MPHRGAMNTFNSHSHSPLTARVSNERDVVAAALFLMGYWPDNSLVLLGSDGQGIGPLLRVDLPILTETPIKEAVSAFLDYLPAESPGGAVNDRVFVLAFTQRNSSRSKPHLNQHKTLREEELLAISNTSLLPELAAQTAQRQLKLLDLIIIGQENLWALGADKLDLEQVCSVADIRFSNVYLDFLTQGHVIAESLEQSAELQSPDPLLTHNKDECDHWLAHAEILCTDSVYQRQTLNPHPIVQLQADITIWGQVLTAIAEDIRNQFGEAPTCIEAQRVRRKVLNGHQEYMVGDRLRNLLTPTISAHLASSMESKITLQFVLGSALESPAVVSEAIRYTAATEGKNWAGPHQEPCQVLPPAEDLRGIGCPEHTLEMDPENLKRPACPQSIRHMATSLLGAKEGQPQWLELIALESLAALLENISMPRAEAHFMILQAWIRWCFGYSSEAEILLTKADLIDEAASLLPIKELISSGAVPLWITETPVTPRK
ncbi:DUF4192 family protein [Rothia nasimurium]|uniref:DUF4192 family protein n=1 Tax=Rothia nasimurium TaxID=85336 RepID=UPI003B9EA548